MEIPVCAKCNVWAHRLPDWERARLTLKCPYCKALRLAPETPVHVTLDAQRAPRLPGLERE